MGKNKGNEALKNNVINRGAMVSSSKYTEYNADGKGV